MKKFNLAILKNENDEDHREWITACENFKDKVNYSVIEFTKHDWLENILSKDFDLFLTRPSDKVSYFKQLYDERLITLHLVLKKPIYPSLTENLIYENKRMLAYWLQSNNISHPTTNIFYYKEEALEFAKNCKLPVVSKSAIGSSGTGVKIFREAASLIDHVNEVFSPKGVKREWGVNLRKEDLIKRGFNALTNIKEFSNKISTRYNASSSDPQRNYLILQDFIKCDFEWRAVKIGNSFFAHKKLSTVGDKFSGTAKVSWDGPSKELLEFVKYVCGIDDFKSQAVDVFEPQPGKFFVNELQCFFGSKNPHQMIVNGKPGRYRFINSDWVFEEGEFNKNNSYDLRIEHILEILSGSKKEITA